MTYYRKCVRPMTKTTPYLSMGKLQMDNIKKNNVLMYVLITSQTRTSFVHAHFIHTHQSEASPGEWSGETAGLNTQ